MSWQPEKLSKQQLEERRLEGGRLLGEGKMTQAEIARHLGVSQVAVAKWKQRLDASNGDLQSLAATTAPGHHPRLSAEQWQQITQMILAGAQAAGFSTERWTLPRIQQAIQERFAVRYSAAWLSIRLRQLGLSVQRPQTTARRKDDQLAEAWLRNDWETIKKSITQWRSHHVR
jgi:transposase